MKKEIMTNRYCKGRINSKWKATWYQWEQTLRLLEGSRRLKVQSYDAWASNAFDKCTWKGMLDND